MLVLGCLLNKALAALTAIGSLLLQDCIKTGLPDIDLQKKNCHLTVYFLPQNKTNPANPISNLTLNKALAALTAIGSLLL
jgi:hypothetical protein